MLNGEGSKRRVLTGEVTRVPSNALGVWGVISQASAPETRGAPVRRVRVELELMNAGSWPWAPAGAALLSEGRDAKALRVSPLEPISWQGASRQVVVETELTEGEARGTYTLKLWDTSGSRLVVLGGVTFP